jgi:L,D-transpeptidase catalytic domain
VHRARKRRYGRIGLLAGSLVLTTVAAGAATGLVPYAPRGDDRVGEAVAEEPAPDDGAGDAVPNGHAPDSEPVSATELRASRERVHDDASRLPDRSGDGRRIVYDMSDQRVWLVRADESVERRYLVSGSVHDNLRAGGYEVYSRSRHTLAFDQQSTMNYMVRFAEGDNAAIGFHDIPEDLAGRPVQTVEQLGTARSHGCIRQRTADARALWRFAAVGTPVRVLG